ncbi:MAG: acyl-CoA dehydrogenase C-terminal domain-containing protein [archaeon]|nr:acyl-CoA dehydrogenase C-terminal domain-containing protein [archaeon]
MINFSSSAAARSGFGRLPALQSRSLIYKAPLRDIRFCLHEVLDAQKHFEKLGFDAADRDTVDMIMEESAKFCEDVLAPINEIGDQEGVVFDPKTTDVRTPRPFKEAWSQYVEGGWQALSVPKKYGGTGLPPSLKFVTSELIGTANWAWGMYPGLSMGAINTLALHASEELKEAYMTRISTGEWTGTMCLTEPHCGTDLGICKTRADPLGDNTFKLNGTKIFISCGEHDMADNIIHIVLAKLPDAPAGTEGISLFLVPKYLLKADGTLDKSKKNLVCGGVESKMGIHGSATCIMNFDDSVGYMIGKPNTGLKQMFTFMNSARIGVGIQGLAATEQAYQNSLPYALERGSLRALSGTKYPNRPNDPIIVHGDVRRMLLTQKALSEGGRCFTYFTSLLSDYWLTEKFDEKEKREMDNYLGFFTPILKGFLTEMSLEASSHGMQIWGGHGFIRQNGMEQIYRDARIGTLYEGTTGIQALDLLGRKTLSKKSKYLNRFCGEIRALATPLLFHSQLGSWARALFVYSLRWQYITGKIGIQALKDKEAVGANAVDYLMYSGYVTLGYHWLRMATVASKALKSSPPDADFYQNKLHTCAFYFDKLLPRADGHVSTILKGHKSLYLIPDNKFKTD